MVHHTKEKGDLAVAKTISDLTEKGYAILIPLSEHLPFDLVAYNDGKMFRIQVKYSNTGRTKYNTSWADKRGNHYKKYSDNDFDYYAIYLPDVGVVCYPSISFKGCTIRTTDPKSATPFYWYEDFLEFTDSAQKKTFKDFGVKLKGSPGPRLSKRKVVRPSLDELKKLIWEEPVKNIAKKFCVSDRAVAKWITSYGIEKPPHGYWNRKTTFRQD